VALLATSSKGSMFGEEMGFLLKELGKLTDSGLE
jgi:hypothetical protein